MLKEKINNNNKETQKNHKKINKIFEKNYLY